jgi:hypothetical protein
MVSQAKAMALSRYNQKSISKQVSQEAEKEREREREREDRFTPDSNYKISHCVMSGSSNLPIIVLQQLLVFECLPKKKAQGTQKSKINKQLPEVPDYINISQASCMTNYRANDFD